MLVNAIRIAAIAIAVIYSWLIFSTGLVESSLIRDNARSSIISMANGDAERPYVQRALVPAFSNMVANTVPHSLRFSAHKMLKAAHGQSDFMKEMIRFSRWQNIIDIPLKPYDSLRILTVLACMFASLLVYAFTLRKLAQELFPGCVLLPECTMLFGLFAANALVDANLKLYDFPGMALAALGMLTMLRQQWRAYITIFILACMNKESALLLTLFSAMVFWKHLPMRRWIDIVGVQLVLWALITTLLHLVYSNNAGAYLFHMWALAGREIMILRPDDVATLVVLGWLLFSRWQELPRFLQYSVIMVAGSACVYLLFGMLREYRVFYDSIPVIALLSSYSLWRLVRLPSHYQYSGRRSTAAPE